MRSTVVVEDSGVRHQKLPHPGVENEGIERADAAVVLKGAKAADLGDIFKSALDRNDIESSINAERVTGKAYSSTNNGPPPLQSHQDIKVRQQVDPRSIHIPAPKQQRMKVYA